MSEKSLSAELPGDCPDFDLLTKAAAGLIARAIERADPKDIKELRQITGALKELKELMTEEEKDTETGIIIRIEGDPDSP